MISIPAGRRQRWIILHELAHVFSNEHPGHSPQFCAIYLALVAQFISAAAATVLRAAFDQEGVRYHLLTQPVNGTLSNQTI